MDERVNKTEEGETIIITAEFHGHFEYRQEYLYTRKIDVFCTFYFCRTVRSLVHASLGPVAKVNKLNYWLDPWFVGLQVIVWLKKGVVQETLLDDKYWPRAVKNIAFQTSD